MIFGGIKESKGGDGKKEIKGDEDGGFGVDVGGRIDLLGSGHGRILGWLFWIEEGGIRDIFGTGGFEVGVCK